MAQRLLAGSGVDQLKLVAPLGNVTVLHAAVAARVNVVLPQLVALCAAARVPIDAQIQMAGDCLLNGQRYSPMWRQLQSMGCRSPYDLRGVEHQATALSIAVR